MRDNHPTLQTLLNCLGKLESLHIKLFDDAEAKRQAIVSGDLAALEELLEREKTLVAEIEREETRRQAAGRVAAKSAGLGPEQAKLADLIERLEPVWRQRFQDARNRLRDILDRLRIRNRLNAELLKASLEQVEAFLRSIRSAAGASTCYTRRGSTRQSGDRALLDRDA